MKYGKPCPRHPELCGRRHAGGNCPECIKETKQKYRERTRDNQKAYNKSYRRKNVDRVKELNRRYREQNPGRIRENNLRRLGFTSELFDFAVTAQDGACAICDENLQRLPTKQVHADHCHWTGQARGVLCHHCNTGLGAFNDSPELLARAIQYLLRPTLKGRV